MDAETPTGRTGSFAHAPMGVALAAPDGVLTEANLALADLLGRTPEVLTGQSLFDLTHPDDAAAAREACAELERQPGRPIRYEARLVRADGSAVPALVAASLVRETPAGDPAHLVLIVDDITDRKALEAALVHRSLHDPLTGLPNRTLFTDRLRHALERGHRERTPTCVLIIDLDGFKAINDRYGHPMGDAVLVGFAQRLLSVLRAMDTAARLGGDEFAVVCENTERPEAEVLADRVRTAAAEPLVIGELTVSIGLSIGIGSVPGGADPEAAYEPVVREADDAMYADKATRR